MRIVDEWEEDDMRITVFHMNGRYSIKLEHNLLEQTYKFRDGIIDKLSDLKAMLTSDFYKDCKNNFIHMDLNRNSILNVSEESDDLPTII